MKKYRFLSDWFYYFVHLPLLAFLPDRLSTRLIQKEANRASLMQGPRRKEIERNLRIVFPSLTLEVVSKIADEHFETLSIEELEAFKLLSWNAQNISDYFDFVGLEFIEEVLKRGNGALLFTGHVGSFSSAVPALGHKGFDLSLVVNNSPEERTLHPAYRCYAQMKLRLMEKATRRKFIYFNLGRNDHSLAHAGVLTLSKLRKNELVVIALDVPPHYFRHTAEVYFLGQLCRFPCGYLDLAYKAGSAVLPFVTIRKNGFKDKPEIRVFEPVNLSGHPATDLQTCLDRLSETITEYPSQWYYWDSLAHFLV